MKERNVALDRVRAIAMICVVLAHTVIQVYPLNSPNEMELSSQVFSYTLFTIGRQGVPLFLMLSGYLLLDRDYETPDKIIRFYKNNILSLFLVWEFWILIYQLFLSGWNHTRFNISTYILQALLLKHAGMPHTWYIPMIIGIYFFIPVISIVLKRLNENDKILWFLLGITYIFYFIVPLFSVLQKAFGVDDIYFVNIQIDLSFSGGIYGLYLILGYLIKKWMKKCNKDTLRRNSIVYILSTVLTVIFQLVLINHNYVYPIYYEFALLPITGVSLFIILYKIKISFLNKIFLALSKYSFGVFLFHYLVIYMVRSAFACIEYRYLQLILLTLFVIIISYLAVYLLSKIPFMKKLFLIK